MGVYNSTYVGVFLEVKVETKDVPVKTLKNSKGEIFKSGKFDPNTGEELIEEITYKKSKVSPYPWLEGVSENFWTPEYHYNKSKHVYFLLDIKSKYAKTIEECETIIFSGTVDIPNLIEEFKEEFKEDLKIYSEMEYKYEIKWGVINYSN